MVDMTSRYEQDPMRGFWLSMDCALAITINKKHSTLEDAVMAAKNGELEIIVYANSNIAVNSEGEVGGRITFTIPPCLFAKVKSQAEVKFQFGQLNYHADPRVFNILITQRAPGKHIRLRLKDNLSSAEIEREVASLYKNPLLVQVIVVEQPELNRLSFRVGVPENWVVDQLPVKTEEN